jgi:hypothetical protein
MSDFVQTILKLINYLNPEKKPSGSVEVEETYHCGIRYWSWDINFKWKILQHRDIRTVSLSARLFINPDFTKHY